MAEALYPPEGLVSDLAAFGFGEEREKGADAGVERHCAITAWGLDVALRWVGRHQPVLASMPYQSGFFGILRDGLGHPPWAGIPGTCRPTWWPASS